MAIKEWSSRKWTWISILVNQMTFGFVGRDLAVTPRWDNKALALDCTNLHFTHRTRGPTLALSGHTPVTWLKSILYKNGPTSIYVLVYDEANREQRIHYEEQSSFPWTVTVAEELRAALCGVAPLDECTLGDAPALRTGMIRGLEGDCVTFFNGDKERWAETEKRLDQTSSGMRTKRISTLKKTLYHPIR